MIETVRVSAPMSGDSWRPSGLSIDTGTVGGVTSLNTKKGESKHDFIVSVKIDSSPSGAAKGAFEASTTAVNSSSSAHAFLKLILCKCSSCLHNMFAFLMDESWLPDCTVCTSFATAYFVFNTMAALSVAIKDELKLTNTQLGLLYSSYSSVNSVMPFLVAVFISRCERWLWSLTLLLVTCLLLGAAISAVAVFVRSFPALAIGRIIAGTSIESFYGKQRKLHTRDPW